MQKRRLLLAMLLCAFWLTGFAQKTVTGTVKDATGEPMIGVSVVVDGTSIGGITDADGNFSIPNVSSSAVLKVTYIGYQEQKVTVGNRSVINFVMKEDSQTLDELVVVGYGVVKKSDLTGAVGSVRSSDIVAKGSTKVLWPVLTSHRRQAVPVTAFPCRFVVRALCREASLSM